MKNKDELEIVPVANGFLVRPSRSYRESGYSNEETFVFPTAETLSAWIREKYSPPVPPIVVPAGWQVIPAP